MQLCEKRYHQLIENRGNREPGGDNSQGKTGGWPCSQGTSHRCLCGIVVNACSARSQGCGDSCLQQRRSEEAKNTRSPQQRTVLSHRKSLAQKMFFLLIHRFHHWCFLVFYRLLCEAKTKAYFHFTFFSSEYISHEDEVPRRAAS